ncbi:MAG TPA: tail fiber domain-containing protein, partial [Thermoanaerobaculia bacterium]|nr:tail fiber domain-containing protein [Thermoanaerobaculia bacterium]
MTRLRYGVVVLVVVCGLTFAISVSAGQRPLAVSPGSGAGTVVAGACPTFSWGAVAGATSYELVTYKVPDGLTSTASPADLTELWRVSLPGAARSWTPPTSQCFSHGGSYAWAVRAVVGGETGAWSEANLFEIQAAPSVEEVRGMMSEMQRYLAQDRTSSASAAASTVSRSRGDGAKAPDRRRAAKRLDLGARLRSEKKARVLGPSSGSLTKAAATPALGTPSLSVDANLSLGASSNVFKDGRVLLWNDTTGNLALGDSALASVSGSATDNTAIGYQALASTAETCGFSDCASYNTATGFKAMYANVNGERNTADGSGALQNNTSGAANTAIGSLALFSNLGGGDNVAVGEDALEKNLSGDNTATGFSALGLNTTGTANTADGFDALLSNTTGSRNVAIGSQAGGNPTAPDDSIFIGNMGVTSDTDTIKIGIQGTQTSTYIAGIRGEAVASGDGLFVLVDSNGKLGTSSSSRRYKQDIEDMGDATGKLYALRPVTFRYKQWIKEAIKEGKDPAKLPLEYGLIAEEVAKVFPDLVVYDKRGRPDAVKYRLLIPMLLNELQKEHWAMIEQADELARERAKNDSQQAEVFSLMPKLATMSNRQARREHEIAVLRSDLATVEKRDSAREESMAAMRAELSRLETRLAALGVPRSRPDQSSSGRAAS